MKLREVMPDEVHSPRLSEVRNGFCTVSSVLRPDSGYGLGLSKSVITLTALWDLLLDSFDVGCVLVVAPKRVAEDTWPREIAKWEHLKGLTYSLVMGSEKERRAALSRKAMIYIINRENVSWLVEHTTWRFVALVIDELSSFKSAKAQRFKALKKVRPLCSRVID